MNHLWRRFLSIFLCMSLCVSCFALPAGAEDELEETGNNAVETFAEETAAQETTTAAELETTIAAEQETTIVTEPEESEPAEIYVGTLTYWDQNMIVEVECAQEDNVPASAQMVLTRIDKGHEQFSGYWDQTEGFLAQNGCTEMNFAQFWKIGLEVDGVPVSLSSELTVTVTYVNYTDAVQKSMSEKLHLLSFPEGANAKSVAYSVVESAPDGSGGMLIRKITFNDNLSGVLGLAKTAGQNKTVSALAGNCTVKAEFGTDAQFPENVELEVSQVSASTEAYDTYFAKTKNGLQSVVSGSLVYAQFFDVSFLLDGQELEPAAAVDMTLGFDEGIPMGQTQDLRVIHFLDDGTWELLPVTIVAQEAGENEGETRVKAISFEQSSFSIIGIIVLDKGKTVDVRVDGERFTHVSESSVITVTKVWRDKNGALEGEAVHAKDTVTVELCKVTEVNGQTQYETVQTGTLNDDGGWKCTFTGVVGERSDIYAIRETKVTSGDPEVAATYQSAIATTQTFSETWAQTDTLVNGRYYLIKTPLSNGEQWHLRAASSEEALRNQSAPSTPYSILEGLGDTNTKFSIWQAIDNGDGTWSFYNCFGKEKYLALSNGLWTVSAEKTDGTSLKISNGYISATADGETKYLRFPLEDYHKGKFVAADLANASKIMFYEYDCQIVTCNVTVTNTKNYSLDEHAFNVSAEVSKRIDWLGDGAVNPDTDADDQPQETRQDLYRLYLDYKPLNDATGLDLLLVLDASMSMQTEDAILVVDGVETKVTRAKALYEALKTFVDGFLPDGTRNRLCIVVFDGDSAILQDWSSDRNAVLANIGNEGYFNGSGTNYEGALMRAHEAFTRLGYSSNDKAMVFMSDGFPSVHISGNDGKELGDVTVALGGTYSVGNSGPTGSLGSGLEVVWSQDDDDTSEICAGQAVTSFRRHNPDVVIGTVAFNFAEQTPPILLDLATSPQYALNLKKDEGGTEGLVDAMNLIATFTPSNVAVIDVLSENVELHDDPDFKVTVTDTDGTETVLYDNGKLTAQGKVVLDNNNPISIVGREVRMTFNTDYEVVHQNTYTFSFNVRPNQQAFDRYADGDGTYLNTGSLNTDYAGNTSSSGKSGYYSNDETSRVIWDFGSLSNEKSYSEFMPVIQVRDGSLTIQKVDINTGAALAGVEFALYRAADENDGVTGDYVLVDTGTTDSNGVVQFDHLRLAVFDTGYTYYLEETKPLAGYLPMEGLVELRLYQDGPVLSTEKELLQVLPSGTLQVGNEGFTMFTFKKVAAEDTAKALEGAEFAIYRLACTDNTHDHSGLLDPQNVGDCWVCYDQQTSGEDGLISLKLPINSIYRLIETKAPGGYTLPAGQWIISIGADHTIGITAVASVDGSYPPAFAVNGDGTYKVTNMKPIQIPTTGGSGTGMYHLIGLAAMTAGILLVSWGYKRKTARYS